MSPSLMKVVEHVILKRMLNSNLPFVGRTAIEHIFFMLCALMMAVGCVFLVYALYLYLQTVQTPAMAAGMTGLMALALGGLMGGGQLAVMWIKLRKMKKAQADIEAVVREIITAAHDEVGENVRENPKLAVMVAAFLGYALGDRFL